MTNHVKWELLIKVWQLYAGLNTCQESQRKMTNWKKKKLKRKSTRLCLAPIKDTNEILFKYNIINNLGISILDPGWFFLISLRATESLSCIARASVAWPSCLPYVSPIPVTCQPRCDLYCTQGHLAGVPQLCNRSMDTTCQHLHPGDRWLA